MWFRWGREYRCSHLRRLAVLFFAGAFFASWAGNVAIASIAFPLTVVNPTRDKFGSPNTSRLKDITVVTVGALRIDGIDDRGPFTSNSRPGGRAVKLDGAAIPPGGSGTVVLDLNFNPTGIIPVLIEDTSWSRPPRQPVPTAMNFGTSNMIFSAAIFGDDAGFDFASVHIPPNQYGYFYQVRWTGTGTGPQAFALNIGDMPPTSIGVLNDSWALDNLLPTLTCTPDALGNAVACNVTPAPGMVPENLSGTSGVAPTSWFFSGDTMTARFGSPLTTDDTSAVLWFTHPVGPGYGGPLGLAAENAQLVGAEATLFSAAAQAPNIPEPSTFLFVGSALAIGIAAARGRAARSWR